MGKGRAMVKLKADLDLVFELRRRKFTISKIADFFDVSASTINKILKDEELKKKYNFNEKDV